jgi:hypothetical protein
VVRGGVELPTFRFSEGLSEFKTDPAPEPLAQVSDPYSSSGLKTGHKMTGGPVRASGGTRQAASRQDVRRVIAQMRAELDGHLGHDA